MVGCEHVQPRVRRFECTGTLQSPQIRGQLPRARPRPQKLTEQIDAFTPRRRRSPRGRRERWTRGSATRGGAALAFFV